MSLWGDFIESFKGGAFAVVSHTQVIAIQQSGALGRIEKLCRELDWRWENRGSDSFTLHFSGPHGHREVRIDDGNECLVTLSVHSAAILQNLPEDVAAYLLLRNFKGSGIGMWGVNVDRPKNIWFYLAYTALGAGLTASSLKFICESLMNEVEDFDAKMRSAGLLR